jgi:hypothetical protein
MIGQDEKCLENANPAFLQVSAHPFLPQNDHFYGNHVILGGFTEY